MTRSVAIQSVLYNNEPEDILRAARATINAVSIAEDRGQLSNWSLLLGDCSSVAVLQSEVTNAIGGEVARAGGDYKYEVFGANRGHGGGHNVLALLSDCDLILILNPDALLAPDTLSVLMSTVIKDVELADARQVPLEHPKDYDPLTGDSSWASGACSLTTREAFERIGGFDHETFFMYCDDVDYSWRVKLSGGRVVHQPAARVFHDKRLTTEGEIQASSAEIYYSAEAALLLAEKYSRPEIADRILKSFEAGNDDVHLEVAAKFRSRRATGAVPRPLDASHSVGQFVKGNYAVHRY